jgi:hypothetical protein
MARTRAVKVRRTEKQWVEILRRFKASGLGSRAFCDRDGLPLSSFQRWQHRLGAARPAKFVELVSPSSAPTTAAATSWSLELTLPNGASIRFQG